MSRRVTVPHSGDARPFPASLRDGTLAGWRRLRASPARFVLLAAALALVPLVLATLAFGHAFRASETGRVDARLVASTRIAFDRISAADATALAAARRLAASRDVQVALARHDSAALARLRQRSDGLTVTPIEAGAPPAARPPGSIVETVSVMSGGTTIGRVDAAVRVAPALAVAGRRTNTDLGLASGRAVEGGPLRGWRISGPVGPRGVRFAGHSYRALRESVAPGVGVIAAVPQRSIESTVRRRELVTLAAGALTLAAIAFAGLYLIQRRSSGSAARARRRERSSASLVGDVAAAAHDPRALLPVILETAVVGMDAAGGWVVWDGERIASIGSDAPGGGRLVLPLDDEESSGRREIVLYPHRGGFSAADRDVARSLVAQGRIALENARLQSVVRRQAVTDELTDLANRRRFMEVLQHEVARAARFDTALSLVLFDLDRFKQINDRYGHQTGDDVLRRTAEVIRNRVRETDLPARIGGEEFAVILSGTGGEGAAALAEHLRHDISERVEVVGAREWTVTASFGIAVLHEGQSSELLIGAADRALYRAKAEGRNRVCAADAEAERSPTG